MRMPFGAAHHSSSSFFVFARSLRFHGLQDLSIVVLEMSLDFAYRSQEKFKDKSLEQSGADVSIGLIIVLPSSVDAADFSLERVI